jgi:hypothetical protein
MNDSTQHLTASAHVRATPRARFILSTLLLLAIAFLLLCLFVAIPFIKNSLNTVPPSNMSTVKGILAAFACVAILIGGSTIYYGRKILRSSQYPPANAWVWRDTAIRHGESAIRFGWFHIATGALICIIGLGSTLYLWHVINLALPYFGRPITIIKQERFTRP